jgi:hypothetical protein
LVAPIVFVGLDVVVAEDLAGAEVGDGCGGVVDEDEDWCAAMVAADAEVMKLPSTAKSDFPIAVHDVGSDPVMSSERR